MANSLSPSIATVPFYGFSIHRSPRGTSTSGGSSLQYIVFDRPSHLPLLYHRLTLYRHTSVPFAASARRRNGSSSITARQGKTSKKLSQSQSKKRPQLGDLDNDHDNIDEDAFEALFSMLEEDLKNDNLLDDADGDVDITEEDLNKFEKELEDFEKELDEVLDDIDDPDSDIDDLDSDEDDDEDEEKEKSMPKLRIWQLRRLAAALKQGRRKTSIKNLAAELGLDRAVVLELLREPPPDLLLMSASLPDKAVETSLVETESKQVEPQPPSTPETIQVIEADETKENVPVHVMQSRWSTQKRLKKVQVATLERVYNRTKRPTNAMISSIVHVTNLPWKTVVKWFEDKRREDGVPENRLPYQRSAT